ncbi:MAG: polymerase sigma factor YlaC [Pseudomonadota bacterium]|jgi:RNA polymerase sigma-70 factor (ECF subfamily)
MPSSIAQVAPAAVAATALVAAGAIDFAAHRGAMLRFARRRIRDESLAEDAVQDALVAALSSRQPFEGRSALRTWLIGILNHKIQDVFRRESRYVRHTEHDSDDHDAPPQQTLHDAIAALEAADELDPANEVARRRMRDALIREVEALPPTLREVFMLQAIEGLPTDEVCRRLGITEANCWVRLHRARKRLSERMRVHRD